ncbi:hypothetical protein B0I72DRAFT_15706 [Yarrowia lipolytica]|uniref:Uncharacterized protein n=1 Tax=Yarrowia lipolytica TaxID=4952 RepID=A0A371C0S1_YARLL|nr:hypothetical protein BKA91DRAFT_27061 [Yarrowia lipolytica]KAE8169086.1 hypothetical protein BKA90DRAFT_4735 [Yarrowia lipolytica]RDW23911.1 hypothetical protein B0I71DRAFT_7874 [Yarrowia lipolytica]RDW29939.1 hypothetical protein B0I72DRAFT_15706 [Yarrowia lipolytica]RDW37541.1 hypothetical protein B0I73DRAFT_6183 [Yarrowia lipolytica]
MANIIIRHQCCTFNRMNNLIESVVFLWCLLCIILICVQPDVHASDGNDVILFTPIPELLNFVFQSPVFAILPSFLHNMNLILVAYPHSPTLATLVGLRRSRNMGR